MQSIQSQRPVKVLPNDANIPGSTRNVRGPSESPFQKSADPATYSWEDPLLLTPWPQIHPNSVSGAYEFGGIGEQERDLQAALVWQSIPIWTTQNALCHNLRLSQRLYIIQHLFMVHTLSLHWVPGTKATRRMWKRL